MKKGKSKGILQKTKNHERILWTIVCQQIWQPRSNGQLSRDVQSAKTESKKIDQLNRLITRNEIEYVIKTLPTNFTLNETFSWIPYAELESLLPTSAHFPIFLSCCFLFVCLFVCLLLFVFLSFVFCFVLSLALSTT